MLSLSFPIDSCKAQAKAYFDGHQLYYDCTVNPTSVCEGYVIGSLDTFRSVGIIDSSPGPNAKICFAYVKSTAEVTGIVKKYLEDHPEGWNDTAASQVYQALLAAFPCQ